MDINGVRFKLRELDCHDVNYWLESRGGIDELGVLLHAPEWCKTEYNDHMLESYILNYGNAIRAVLTDSRDERMALIALTNVDFLGGKATLRYCQIKKQTGDDINSVIRNLLEWIKQNTGIYDISVIAEPEGSMLESAYENVSSDIPIDSISLPNYCIDLISEPFAKRAVLHHFDKFMFFPMSQRSNYTDLISKISAAADMLLAYNQSMLGFIAFYANDVKTKRAFVSSIAIDSEFRRQGIGKRLFEGAMKVASDKGMDEICLEVAPENLSAYDFYRTMGLSVVKSSEEGFLMVGKV